MVVYIRASKAQDLYRVTASYTDAQTINDIGSQAVWSDKRQQLSFITSDHLIVHIHIEDNKASAHYGDQTRLYAEKRRVRLPFYEMDIQAAQTAHFLRQSRKPARSVQR